jgi:small subunit ribosomal protein S13
MPSIAGVDVARHKRVENGLNHIHGIGRSRSNDILSAIEGDSDTRVRDLNEAEVSRSRAKE